MILSQVNGFSKLSRDEIRDNDTFKRVDGLLRGVNSENLEGTRIIGAFYQNAGFSVGYKVYYSNPGMPTYEGYVTYDIFRNRLYVISFGSLGYSLG